MMRHVFLCWAHWAFGTKVSLAGSQLHFFGGFATKSKMSGKMQLFGKPSWDILMQDQFFSTWAALKLSSFMWISKFVVMISMNHTTHSVLQQRHIKCELQSWTDTPKFQCCGINHLPGPPGTKSSTEEIIGPQLLGTWRDLIFICAWLENNWRRTKCLLHILHPKHHGRTLQKSEGPQPQHIGCLGIPDESIGWESKQHWRCPGTKAHLISLE
jgi:hypothetical protein